MMDTRTTGAVKFRATLGINQHDPILTKEKSIDSKIMKVFSDEEIIEQYFVLNEKLTFINLNKKDFDVFDKLGKISSCIDKLNKKCMI